jgi:hypothetical protein
MECVFAYLKNYANGVCEDGTFHPQPDTKFTLQQQKSLHLHLINEFQDEIPYLDLVQIFL